MIYHDGLRLSSFKKDTIFVFLNLNGLTVATSALFKMSHFCVSLKKESHTGLEQLFI